LITLLQDVFVELNKKRFGNDGQSMLLIASLVVQSTCLTYCPPSI